MATQIDLAGKVALVTGGGRGLGKEMARRLADAGADVVIASRKLEVLEATAAEFESLAGRVVPLACNVGRADELERLIATIDESVGGVDVLINNSGTNIAQGPALDVTDEAFDKMVDINVKAALRLVRLTVPGMIERGGGGSIINIASTAGLRPQPQGLVYSFTKAGLIMLTRSWAHEFGQYGIRANAIAPGLIKTDFSEFFWKNEEAATYFKSQQAIGRLGVPADIGHAALYLASDESSFMTGQVLVIDGGMTAG